MCIKFQTCQQQLTFASIKNDLPLSLPLALLSSVEVLKYVDAIVDVFHSFPLSVSLSLRLSLSYFLESETVEASNLILLLPLLFNETHAQIYDPVSSRSFVQRL